MSVETNQDDWVRDVELRELLATVAARYPAAYQYYEENDMLPGYLQQEEPIRPGETIPQFCARTQARINANIRTSRAQVQFLRDHGREVRGMAETVEMQAAGDDTTGTNEAGDDAAGARAISIRGDSVLMLHQRRRYERTGSHRTRRKRYSLRRRGVRPRPK